MRVHALAPPGASARLDGELVDVTGSYHRWLAENQCQAVLIRPDFYVYGRAVDLISAQALAADLLADIGAGDAGGRAQTAIARA